MSKIRDFTTSYNQKNVVGPVSQSGGIPTGAIIERGSNANGEYTKYADGTLECWVVFPDASITCSCTSATGVLYFTANGYKEWTFPHEFIDTKIYCSSNGYVATGSAETIIHWVILRNNRVAGLYVGLGRPGTGPLNSGRAYARGRWY